MASYQVSKHRKSWRVFLITEYVDGVPKRKHVSVDDYAKLSIHKNMSIEEARAKIRPINANQRWADEEAKRQSNVAFLKKKRKEQELYLPKVLTQKFETQELEEIAATNKKILSHWETARVLLAELKLEAKHLYHSREKIYRLFEKKHYSYSYCRKLLAVINRWILFNALLADKHMQTVPQPSRNGRERINDSYFKAHGQGKASDRLTPDMLERSKGNLIEENYNWLFLSIWFGLRPVEVDSLKDPSRFKIENQDGHLLLKVYQPKLTSLQWKTSDKAWSASANGSAIEAWTGLGETIRTIERCSCR